LLHRTPCRLAGLAGKELGTVCIYFISVSKFGSKFIEKSFSVKRENSWTLDPRPFIQVLPLFRCKEG
jgi:hypothetical protein